MQSNEMTVNLEQRFLQSRESRVASLAASSTTTARHQELGRFWTELRQRLRTWTTRLEHVETRQELQDLQEELRTLRHHCLKPTLDFAVPTELPPADWRLLHAEFTKCATLWETVQIQRYPKGKFIFQRYRQEVGRRKALGIPLASEQSKKNSMELASRYHTHFSGNTGNDHDDDNNTSSSGPGPASLESVANAIICIQNDGTVQIQPNHGQDPYTISSAAVLLRNIQNCTIQICKVLEALHLVHVSDTTILVASPIASSIHITSCQHCTIQAHAQQLRIHDSQMLKLEIDLVAGAILEGSHDILFQRPVEVKDFDWLRAGVPSPNFRIEDTVNLDKELSTIPALAVTTPTPSTIPIETKTFMAPLVEALPSKECTIDEQDDDDDDDEL